MELVAFLLGSAFLLVIPLILFVLAVIGIVIFIIVANKITKGRSSSDDDFMRMHNDFMDTSRRVHETHVNMHNNMFR